MPKPRTRGRPPQRPGGDCSTSSTEEGEVWARSSLLPPGLCAAAASRLWGEEESWPSSCGGDEGSEAHRPLECQHPEWAEPHACTARRRARPKSRQNRCSQPPTAHLHGAHGEEELLGQLPLPAALQGVDQAAGREEGSQSHTKGERVVRCARTTLTCLQQRVMGSSNAAAAAPTCSMSPHPPRCCWPAGRSAQPVEHFFSKQLDFEQAFAGGRRSRSCKSLPLQSQVPLKLKPHPPRLHVVEDEHGGVPLLALGQRRDGGGVGDGVARQALPFHALKYFQRLRQAG